MAIIAGKEVNYLPKQEMENQLRHYISDIRYMMNDVKAKDIKTWLEQRGVRVPLRFLKNFIETLKTKSTGKPEFKEGKAVINPDDSRSQKMTMGEAEEKDVMKEMPEKIVMPNEPCVPGEPPKIRGKTKICTRCKKEKPLSAFGKHKGSKDGHQWWCIDCNRDYWNDKKNGNTDSKGINTISKVEQELLIDKLCYKLKKVILNYHNRPITIEELMVRDKTYNNTTSYRTNFQKLIDAGKVKRDKVDRTFHYWPVEIENEINMKIFPEVKSSNQLRESSKRKVAKEIFPRLKNELNSRKYGADIDQLKPSFKNKRKEYLRVLFNELVELGCICKINDGSRVIYYLPENKTPISPKKPAKKELENTTETTEKTKKPAGYQGLEEAVDEINHKEPETSKESKLIRITKIEGSKWQGHIDTGLEAGLSNDDLIKNMEANLRVKVPLKTLEEYKEVYTQKTTEKPKTDYKTALKEQFAEIEKFLIARNNKPVGIPELNKFIEDSDHRTNRYYNKLTLFYKMISDLVKQGYLLGEKDPADGRRKLWKLANYQEPNIPQNTPSTPHNKQPDFKSILESKKIDLLKMFAANIATPAIMIWLEKWGINVTYNAIVAFYIKHESEIETLKKQYKTGIAGLKEHNLMKDINSTKIPVSKNDIYNLLGVKKALWEDRKTYDELVAENKELINHLEQLQKSPHQLIHLPTINELSEIFNIPDVDIVFNAKDKDSFLWICKTLNDHDLDFELIADSQNKKYGIFIAGEEVE